MAAQHASDEVGIRQRIDQPVQAIRALDLEGALDASPALAGGTAHRRDRWLDSDWAGPMSLRRPSRPTE
jgi:hypothetical protein